jgi:hypothetical protein
MVRRVYFCTNDDCDNVYEKYQQVNEIDRTCDICGEKVFQDLTGVYGSVSDPKTLGALADRNSAKMGQSLINELESKREAEFEAKRKEEREKIMEAVPGVKFPETKKKEPWFGKLPENVKKDIFSKKGEEQSKRIDKYINEGK